MPGAGPTGPMSRPGLSPSLSLSMGSPRPARAGRVKTGVEGGGNTVQGQAQLSQEPGTPGPLPSFGAEKVQGENLRGGWQNRKQFLYLLMNLENLPEFQPPPISQGENPRLWVTKSDFPILQMGQLSPLGELWLRVTWPPQNRGLVMAAAGLLPPQPAPGAGVQHVRSKS